MELHTNPVRRLRLARDLTQEQLADLSGVDQSTISRLETDDVPSPLYVTLNSIARVLGVPTDALVEQPTLAHDKRKTERRRGPRRPDRRAGMDRRHLTGASR